MPDEKSSKVDRETILWKVREKLISGQLPRIAAVRTWGGPGAGQPCSVCDEIVLPDTIEIEVDVRVDGSSLPLNCHSYCYSLWDIERQSLPHQLSPQMTRMRDR